MNEIKNTLVQCPNCGASHYFENYSISTAIGFSPEWKNGEEWKNKEYCFNDPNYYTTYCNCAECGSEFFYTKHNGEITTTLTKAANINTEKLKESISKTQKSWSVSAEELNKARIEYLKEEIERLQKELERLEFYGNYIGTISNSTYKTCSSCGE